MNKECKHKRIHTERLLLAEKDKDGEMILIQPTVRVIDSYCADCGRFLKQVKIN